MKCSICNTTIEKDSTGWEKGHNAHPINDGRCCVVCNSDYVVLVRMKIYSILRKYKK